MVLAPVLRTGTTNGLWQLPEGWEWVKIDDACSLNPSRPRLHRSEQAPTSFVPMSGVDEVYGVINALETKPFFEVARGFTYFEEGDVLFAKITPSMENGKSAIAQNLLDKIGFGSTEFHVIRPGTRIIPEWVHLYFRRLSFRLEAKKSFRGAVGQQRVPDHFLKSFPIPMPPSLEIQRRIVARIRALLAEVKRARTLLNYMRRDIDRFMKTALMSIFGRIRDGFEVKGIPQDQVRPIGDVARLERGKFSHRPRNDPRFFGGTVPWIQIQSLPRSYSKYITEPMDTLNDQGLAISKIFPQGTLVLSIAATIGAVGILAFDACFPDSLVGVTPNTSTIDVGFLYWQLIFLRDHLEAIAPSAAQKNINLQILSRINLWVPSLEKQKAINEYLESVQSAVEELDHLSEQNAKLLDQLEQSILERAFRGEL